MATNDVYLRPDAGDGANGVRLRPDAPDVATINYVLSCAAGAYVYAGQAATFTLARRLALDAGAYLYAGQDADLVYTPGAGTVNYTLACDAGAYLYSGKDATLTYVTTAAPQVGGGAIFPPGWYGRNRQRRQEAVELEELLESAPLPVQSAIRTQSRARLESMEADERAIRAAAEAARIEWDAFYMRLLAYQREEALIEEEAIVMTMIAALSE